MSEVHAAHAHAQPPPGPPLLAPIAGRRWHTPSRHDDAPPSGSTRHGRPSPYQAQPWTVSARHSVDAAWSGHGSTPASDATPHSHAGQSCPAAQAGQTHVVVPPPVPPLPVEPAQSHAQGAHVSPGSHAGQLHVHVDPPRHGS
jgi:hypothetical protein